MSGRPDVVDPSAVERLHRIGGAPFVAEMIDLFLEHAPQRLSAARTAFEERDYRTLYRAAHSLKSTAGNLGARPLQATAEQVESRAVDEDGEAIPPLLDELEERYAIAREELESVRNRRQGSHAERTEGAGT